MLFLRHLVGGIRGLIRRRRLEADLDDELRAYLEAAIDAKVAQGLSPQEARRQARAEMGSTAAVKDWVRDVGWETRLESVWQDVRYAVRTLTRSPSFTIAAILTFALGVGTALAVFTLSDGMLFRPLPYSDPDRLVLIQGYADGAAYNRVERVDFEWLATKHSGFEGIATLAREGTLIWMGADGAEALRTSYGTPNLLQLLGVGAHVGRPLGPGDEIGVPRPAMLSFQAWQRHFGADRGVVDRTIRFEQQTVQIVGVLPERFIYPLQGSLGDGDVFLVRALDPAGAADPRAGVWTPIARLKPGVSIAQAQSEVDLLVHQAAHAFPSTPQQRTLRVANLQFALFELNRQVLWLLVAAAGGVLLIACTNVANLLLARGRGREREIGIRTAIGASRARVARQLLVESAVLGVAGGAVALLAAFWAFDAAAAYVPARYRLVPQGLEPRLVLFTLIVSCVSSIVFGVYPAFRVSAADVTSAMRETRQASGSGGRVTGGGALVGAQVAICLILLSATALTANSLIRRRTTDLGFVQKDVVLLRSALGGAHSKSLDAAFTFDMQVLNAIRALPRVRAAAIDFPQVGGYAPWMRAVAPGMPAETGVWSVTPGYFETMGIRMVEGRDFLEPESARDAPVAIVSESVARSAWPNQHAIGKLLRAEKLPPLTVIGVVRDVRSGYGNAIRPAVYRPMARGRNRMVSIMARSEGSPQELALAMRTIVQRLDRRIVVPMPETLGDTLNSGIADSQFQTMLFALFGLTGLLVSAAGVYGVMAHWVNSRTREFGIRMALGADGSRLKSFVVREASIPLVAGMAAGLFGAYALTERLESLLYEVKPHDPATFALVVITVALAGLVAAFIPARRAARVDPVIALRAE